LVASFQIVYAYYRDKLSVITLLFFVLNQSTGTSRHMYTSLHGHITELRLCGCSDFCILLSAGCCCGCCMLRFVQHAHTVVKDATGCKICLTEPTHTNRCTSECLHDVRLKLFSRSSLLLSAGCCAIAAGFVQHLDTAWHKLQVLL
jgi:hypothetical protein